MQQNVTLEKIQYMMDRVAGNDKITPDDLESMIRKVFIASFEYEHGFEASLIQALVDARHVLLCHENTSDDDDPPTLSSDKAEKWYLKCQKEMYLHAGCDESYAEESASWPDALPLIADWDTQLLKDLSRAEVAHHLVVLEQLRREYAHKQEAPPAQ